MLSIWTLLHDDISETVNFWVFRIIPHALVLREKYYLRGMPKQALKVYLNNITDFVGPNGPQLISLNAPFSVIKAGIVSFKAK